MTGKEADLERGVDDSILVVCSVLPCHADRHARSFADVTAGWLGGAGEARELVPAGPDCSLASVLGGRRGSCRAGQGRKPTDGRTDHWERAGGPGEVSAQHGPQTPPPIGLDFGNHLCP